MASPVNFPQKNMNWYGAGDTGDLPVYQEFQKGENISCWKLTPAELDIIERTGVVWLHVWTRSHPAVCIEAESPFKENE